MLLQSISGPTTGSSRRRKVGVTTNRVRVAARLSSNVRCADAVANIRGVEIDGQLRQRGSHPKIRVPRDRRESVLEKAV